MALKTEFIGLAVMSEIPLVIVDVQRGGPSTGLPTKVEQADLTGRHFRLARRRAENRHGRRDHRRVLPLRHHGGKLAETFRGPVIVLTDANLATGVQPFPDRSRNPDWFTAPIDQSPWKKGVPPYDWDEETGISPRPVPGQKTAAIS